jgi:hypothetical protein
LILRSDSGFNQSSPSSRAELIPKVAVTANKFGINQIEEIPDDEYAELQRVGFMSGVVKLLTNVIATNLGASDARIFRGLATRFYINQEFDKLSEPYEKLEAYLNLIEYYRKQKT